MDAQLIAAHTHLTAASPVFVDLIARHDPEPLIARPPAEYFEVLVRSIVGQQVSVKAAASINARLFGAFAAFTPDIVSRASIEHLREQGLSRSKAMYVLGLSEAFRDGIVNPHELVELSDNEVLASLTQLKGIGPWTAEMFLMFAMGRPDVWSMGDLGLRKAVWALFGEEADFDELTQDWRPFRTYAALYLWEHTDNPPNQS